MPQPQLPTEPAPAPPRRRRGCSDVRVLFLALVCAVLAGSCASDQQVSTQRAAEPANTTKAGRPGVRGADALGRRQRTLLRHYEPASARINFFVSEYQLYRSDLRTPAQVVAAIDTYVVVLRGARRDLREAASHRSTRVARSEMIEALDLRIAALGSLRRALLRVGQGDGAAANGSSPDRLQYLRDWDSSLGHARVALNEMQRSREAAGLAPAREDSIR